MGIYTDGQGNHYLGDLQYGNHLVAYPDQFYLKSDQDYSNLVENITIWLNNAGWEITSMSDQSVLNDMIAKISNSTFSFGVKRPSDTNERYKFFINGFSTGTGNSTLFIIQVNNDEGERLIVDTPSSRNYKNWNPDQETPIGFFGIANEESISFGFFSHNYITNRSQIDLSHAGKLKNVNTNLNYYTSNDIYNRVLWWASSNYWNQEGLPEFAPAEGSHYRPNNTPQDFYVGLEAQYPIICSDDQTATAQWASYAVVFDNDSLKGFPGIGTLQNIIAGIGEYDGGKPIIIAGDVQPSAGYNTYLPLVFYAGKVILVRCYSSGLSDA